MVFSSLIFLSLFLPIFLITYYIVPRRCKNAFALLSSLFFFAWGAPKIVFLLVIFSFLDYRISLLFKKFKGHPQESKWLMAVSILANISSLGYFKYSNFFVHELNNLLSVFGQQPFQWTEIVLPIGISFFTFQKISYVIDVYRGTTEPANCFSDFLLYVALFPQLIAGPIIRITMSINKLNSALIRISFFRWRGKILYRIGEKVAHRQCHGGSCRQGIFDSGDFSASVIYMAWRNLLLIPNLF